MPWKEEKIIRFREKLLTWYDQNKRDLPWRKDQNPYHIWVSEIMLQQTQVDTVIPYYNHFIKTLPSVENLAEAEESMLLSLWQGLGYYSRVRNMQKAAQQIMLSYDGEIPRTVEELLTLKGIGPYTAGAISSIAFNQVEPAMDGNLIRITTRLFEIKDDISKASTKNQIMAYLYQLIDPERPGDFNQALMDLGATIHTPSNYDISDSPIKEFDQSYINETSYLYPVKTKKIKVTEHKLFAYAIFNNNGHILLRKHTESELLTGLWHFPLVEIDMYIDSSTDQEIIEPLCFKYKKSFNKLKIDCQKLCFSEIYANNHQQILNDYKIIKHIFSHRVWNVQLIPLILNDSIENNFDDYCWIDLRDIATLPISNLQLKLINLLDSGFEEII